MPKVLKEKTNIISKKTLPMKKTLKKSELPTEIDQIKLIAEMIRNLEEKCEKHGLGFQLAKLKKEFRPSILQWLCLPYL